MKLCITGGGTGGHLMIAQAIAQEIQKSGDEAIFIGSTNGQDQLYFKDSSLFSKRYFLETTGVVNQRGFKKIGAIFQVIKAFFRAKSILKELNIEATYSVGGYSSAPASIASLLSSIPLFIHEQNAVEGKLNSLLKPYAASFISAYDENSIIKGYPVSQTFYDSSRVRKSLNTIIFLGGSHGAKAINDLALHVAQELSNRGVRIIHQAGKSDESRVRDEYKKLGIEVELYGFTKELATLIPQADLSVSRAGASTLWELTTNGCPTFFIPYPYAAKDHQYHNAKFIVDNNLGWCERESDELATKFLDILDNLELEKKSEALIARVAKDVAKEMILDVKKTLTKECL